MPRSSKRIAAWLASFAMLLGSFAPLISHFFPARYAAAPWEEICTSQGLQRISAADLPVPQVPTKRKGATGHCPFCLPHAGLFAVPSSPSLVLPVVEHPRFLPTVNLDAPRLLLTWAAAQPRAPPP